MYLYYIYIFFKFKKTSKLSAEYVSCILIFSVKIQTKILRFLKTDKRTKNTVVIELQFAASSAAMVRLQWAENRN